MLNHAEVFVRSRFLRRWMAGVVTSFLALGLAAAPALGATFVVNTTDDDSDANFGDGSCSTGTLIVVDPGPPTLFGFECTLRAAIEEANNLAGADVIQFSAILPTVAGVVEIFPSTPLPFILDPLTVDGYSAAGYDVANPDARPIINLGGSSSGAGSIGLAVLPGADNSTIRGLAISDFTGDGILVSAFFSPGPTNVTIEGCHIGISRGLFYRGNDGNGINVSTSGVVTIGKTCTAGGCTGKRNVIATNTLNGIRVSSSNVSIAGNLIGTDTFGSSTFVPFGGSTPNGEWGVHIVSGAGNDVGAADADGGNLISGNTLGGVRIESGGNFLLSNKIGTNLAGVNALANNGPGVDLAVGGNFVGAFGRGGNLISGNLASGITSVDDNQIVGNTIGLTDDQSALLANSADGIVLTGSSALVAENVIGGGADGIDADGSSHRIVENFIGTNAQGIDFGSSRGIHVRGSSIQIGDVDQGNVIGFHTDGIDLVASSASNIIQGNFIGIDLNGNSIPNNDGVQVAGTANTIGGVDGLTNGLANLIGFNTDGIDVFAADNTNEIIGNYIGTNSAGDNLGNTDTGVELSTGPATVGGSASMDAASTAARANVIAFNGDDGVDVQTSLTGTSIRGNELFANADLGIDLPGGSGIPPNDVGDVDTGGNNLQNFPEFEPLQTQFNDVTGNLEVRYRVDSNEGDSAYPLTVDFYLRETLPGEAEVYIGSDTYPAASATLFRSVAVTPLPGVVVSGALRATATDANGNTSHLSDQPITVPEPGGLALLASGSALVLGLQRRRRDQRA